MLLSAIDRELIRNLPQLLVQVDDLGQILLHLVAPLGICGALFFEVAQIDKRVQLFGFLPDRFGDFDGAQLNQCRSANRLLHPQLTAFHATCKINFAFARQQRDGAHFAQIHAYRIIRVNRLFGRMRSRKVFAIMSFLGMKKCPFLIERNPERLVALA